MTSLLEVSGYPPLSRIIGCVLGHAREVMLRRGGYLLLLLNWKFLQILGMTLKEQI